jgi:hypothetical protein
MRFHNSAWEVVGSAGFSAGAAQYISLAFNPSTNEPYVAYEDNGNSGSPTVMRFHESAWVAVGSEGFNDDEANYVSLAFNSTTYEPYVAYKNGNSNKASVMRFHESAWAAVGSADFSTDEVNYTNLAFNPSTNEPYVAYEDSANSDKATVMKFNGASWEAVGSAGFSAGAASDVSLAFNPTTYEPYVAYFDDISTENITVMKFNSNEVADPVASPAAGTYSSDQSITLSTTTAGATIYYTTDGNTPTDASTQYSSPISISSNVTLKAIAIKSGMTDSSVFSGVYTFEDESSSDSGKDTVTPKRTISNSPKKVARGNVLIQRGKKFSKNSIVQLYFSKPGGGYYAPSTIKTSKSGAFTLSYRANKPKGTYSWYAFDTKAGKKSKVIKYTIK